MPLVETPLMIESLDDDSVVFRGSAVETSTRTTMFGAAHEVESKFPALMLQREVWLSIGAPTSVMVRVETMPTLQWDHTDEM